MPDDTPKDSHGAHKFLEAVRKLTRRYGAGVVVVFATLVSIGVSLIMTVLLSLWLRGFVPPVDLIIAGIVPVIIAPLALYGFVTLVHQLDLTEAHLRRLVSEDELTGVHNRRHILSLAEHEWAHGSRYKTPFSLLMLDVDHFKRINDTCGHAAGDLVLQKLAQTCQAHLRDSDSVGRIGGEEFLVLLPNTGEDGAIKVGEHLRLALAALELEAEGRPLQITVSLGAASRRPGTPNLERLLKEADDALYAAKSAGRNQVRVQPSYTYSV